MDDFYKQQVAELADGIIESIAKISDAMDEFDASPKDPADIARVIYKLKKEGAWIDAVKIDAGIIKEIIRKAEENG